MPIDMSLASKAPPAKAPRAATATRRTKAEAQAETAHGVIQLGQFGLIMARQFADAAALGIHGTPVVDEVVKLGKTNESVGKGIEYLDAVGPYAGLITAMMPLIFQVLANHGRIPAGTVPGILPPDVLEAKMKAELTLAAAQAMAEATAVQAEADRVMSEAQQYAAAQNGQPVNRRAE